MSDTLFAVPPVLTDRQQAALEYVAANQPVRARELGRFLHLARGCRFCTDEIGCRYAESAGLPVLKALKAKGVLRLRRDGWHTVRVASSQGELPRDF